MKRRGLGTETWITALAVLLFGILLIIWPRRIANMVVEFVGIVLIGVGAFNIARYYIGGAAGRRAERKLYGGILLFTLGVIAICFKRALLSVAPWVLGVMLLISGLSKIPMAFHMRSYGSHRWGGAAVSAVVSAVLGIAIMLHPYRTSLWATRLLGIAMSIESVQDLATLSAYARVTDGGWLK